MIGFTVALPFVISFYLYNHRHNLYSTKIHQRMGWLYDDYVRGAEFWQVHDVLWKMILTGLLIYIPENFRAGVASLICVVAVANLNYFQPHKNKLLFWLSQLSFVTTTAKYIIAMLLCSSDERFCTLEERQEKEKIGFLLIVLDFTFIICSIAAILLSLCFLRSGLNDIEQNSNDEEGDDDDVLNVADENDDTLENDTEHNATKIVPKNAANDFSITSASLAKASVWEIRKKVERMRSTKRKVDTLHKKHRQSQIKLENDIHNKQTQSKDRLNQRLLARQQLQRFKVMNILKATKAFAKLKESAIKSVVEAMVYQDYVMNDVLCLQGDIADYFFVIVEGTCKVTVHRAEGAVLKEDVAVKTDTPDGEEDVQILNDDVAVKTDTPDGEEDVVQILNSDVAVKTDTPDGDENEGEDESSSKELIYDNELRVGTLTENQCFGDAAIPNLTTEQLKKEMGDISLHLHHANTGIRAATVTAISEKVKVLCLSTNQFAILMKDGVIGAKTLNSLYKTKDLREDMNEALLLGDGGGEGEGENIV